jgi:hypothetical protein
MEALPDGVSGDRSDACKLANCVSRSSEDIVGGVGVPGSGGVVEPTGNLGTVIATADFARCEEADLLEALAGVAARQKKQTLSPERSI